MKNLILTLFFVSLNFVQSQSIEFHSELEKQFFEIDSTDNNNDFIKGLFAIDSLTNEETIIRAKNELDKIINSFPEKELKERKERKRVKSIYSVIHNKFLRKYEINSYFHNIFTTGNYNCVSATALYAYIFKNLNIPFIVKESPTHVFLIAYPETYKIYIETTVPGEYAFFIPKDSEIKKIIDELVSMKVISHSEVVKKGYKTTFEDYFYTEESIKMDELIGIQYYNQGMFLLNDLKNDAAYNSFLKAQKSYNSPLIKSYIKQYLVERIANSKFDKNDDVFFLIQTLKNEEFVNDFDTSLIRHISFSMIKHNSIEKLKEYIQIFENPNSKNIQTIQKKLYEHIAINEAESNNSKQALLFADKLLDIDSENKYVKDIINHFAFKLVFQSTYSKEDLNSFNETTNKYPFLKKNYKYPIALCYFYSFISYNYYVSEEIVKGDFFRKKFENVLDKFSIEVDLDKKIIVSLYLRAGNSHYYKENYKKAYSIYKKGLKYVPQNLDLKKRMGWAFDEL